MSASVEGVYHVVDDEDDDHAYHSDEHAVEVEAGNPGGAEPGEEETRPRERPQPEHDVQKRTPSPRPFTILLAMKPAMSSSTELILMIDMSVPYLVCIVLSEFALVLERAAPQA